MPDVQKKSQNEIKEKNMEKDKCSLWKIADQEGLADNKSLSLLFNFLKL